MTLSWPDVDSLGLLPSDVCLFDVLSQPVKVPPPVFFLQVYPLLIREVFVLFVWYRRNLQNGQKEC